MKIFLDDLRDPPDKSWSIARSIQDFQKLVLSGKPITHMSFDHDLGEKYGRTVPSGMDAAKWFVELCLDKPKYSANIEEIRVHSANPAGAENILSYFMSAKAYGIINDYVSIKRK